MSKKIEGIVPVMLTPYKADGSIDYASLEKLIEWYIANGADALFAVCQSSEMYFLSVKEKEELGKFVVKQVNGRIPVVASGHTSDDPYEQVKELTAAVNTGADGVVLVSNHLDPKNKGTETFKGNLDWILSKLPKDLPLGVYECPAPYRRLISDDEMKYMADTGRFKFIKDVSCDFETVKRRIELTKDSGMAILNANAAIAWEVMKAGGRGFNGVNLNMQCDLYKWLYTNWQKYPEFARELSVFLVMSACTESYGYPIIAKRYQQRIGNFETLVSRSYAGNVYDKVWGFEPIVDKLMEGSDIYREKIRNLK